MMRWKVVPSKPPAAAVFAKKRTWRGASSASSLTVIGPASVSSTASAGRGGSGVGAGFGLAAGFGAGLPGAVAWGAADATTARLKAVTRTKGVRS